MQLDFVRKIYNKGGVCARPLPRDAAYKETAKASWERKRDDVIAAIHGCGRDDIGKQLWKMCLGYHERSVVETAMFRIKRMFGS